MTGYTIRPDPYGTYEVVWPSGVVRMGYLNREDARIAADYFDSRDRDKAAGTTAADRETS